MSAVNEKRPELVSQFLVIIQDPCQSNVAKYLYSKKRVASGLHLKFFLTSPIALN
jgi:hypothetical protein